MITRSNALLWALSLVLFLALAGASIYKAWPLLFPEIVVSAALDPECDLRAGSCVSELPQGGSIRFAIEPRSLPPLRPLQLEVFVEGMDAHGVEVDFSGLGMNMGFNRPRLDQVGAGHFVGQGTLPVCVRDSMEWEAKVLVSTDEGLVVAPYRFVARKSGQPDATGLE